MLRPFIREDVDDLRRLWVDPAMRKYLWDDEVISRETAVEVVEASLESFYYSITREAFHSLFSRG